MGIDVSKETVEEKSRRAYRIFNILRDVYPDARILLNFNNPFELLVATILAAQCTDERVNSVTPNLFSKYPDPVSLSKAPIEEIESIIKPTGFYKNKAKSIKKLSEEIVNKYSGEVPRTMEELSSLPGVGRKTANVVLTTCFNIPGIIVDTHLRRVTQRLGLTNNKDPDKIERDISILIKPEDQTKFSHVIGFHGRYRCKARAPQCAECEVKDLCPSSNT